MFKKDILNGKKIEETESSLSEIEKLIRESLKGATFIKQIFETRINKGMSFHSVNKIDIKNFEVGYFNENLILMVNDSEFSMAISNQCNVTIQRPQSCEKCRIFFNDFQMWLNIY